MFNPFNGKGKGEREMKVTPQELQERQSWTLYQKIDHALGAIDSFLSVYPNAVVAYSGGLDSTVMLHLARIVKPDIKAVFANTTNEFSDIVRFVKDTGNVDIVVPKKSFIEVLETEGFPLVSKIVARMIYDCRHPTDNNEVSRNRYLTGVNGKGEKCTQLVIPQKYRFLLDVPFETTYKCCDYLKKNPMKKLSKNGVIVGTMAENSQSRKNAYLNTSCVDIHNRACRPMSIWLKHDIWQFIRNNKIPYCKVYDEGEENTGCVNCGFGCMYDKYRFCRLQNREPQRLEKILSVTNNGIEYGEALRMVGFKFQPNAKQILINF